MVVGKGGDTVKVASQNINTLSPIIRDSLMKKNDFEESRIHYKTDSLKPNSQCLSSSGSRWCYRNF